MKKDLRVEKYAKEIAEMCPAKNKRKVRDMISMQVMDFLDMNPDAGMDEIYMTFGTPKSFAENYLSTYSTKELVKSVKTSFTYKKAVACVLVFAFIAVALLGAFGIQMAVSAPKGDPIVYECKVDGIDISITVVAESEMSDEEMEIALPIIIEQLKNQNNIK